MESVFGITFRNFKQQGFVLLGLAVLVFLVLCASGALAFLHSPSSLSAICPTAGHHLELVASLAHASIPQQLAVMAAVLMTLLVMAVVVAAVLLLPLGVAYQRTVAFEHGSARDFSYLVRLFASGILNPKTF